MLVVTALLPVFLIIALGAALQKSKFVSPNFLREANRLTYWLGLPALLFSQLVASLKQAEGTDTLLTVMLVLTLAIAALAYLVGWIVRVPGSALGTFAQGAFRGNLAFVGLPIIYALPDVPVAGGIGSHAAAIVIVAPTMVLYNVAGVVALVISRHAFGPKMLGPVLRQLAVTPPLLATLAGIGFVAAGWTLPVPVARTFDALGEMALPLGLLGVGGSLVNAPWRDTWLAPFCSAFLKTAGSALLAWLLARGCGLSPAETRLVMVLAAAPTAIVSFTLTVELKGDEQLASSTIAMSVLLSLPVLAAVVAFV